MTRLTLQITLSIVTVFVGLGIGLFLRYLLVRRLKKTVLDEWLVQTLGIIIVLPTLIIAIAFLPTIISWDIGSLEIIWRFITTGIQAPDVRADAWNIIISLLVIVLAVGIGRTMTRLVMRNGTEGRLDPNIRILLSRISYGLVIIVASVWVITLWGISISLPVAVLGTLTVAVTFAIQDILKDLVAGLYLLVEHPFRIGDQITTMDRTGRVENVELRATKLRMVSGEEVSIPNALVFGGVVVNNTQYTERRATLTITLPQDAFVRDETPERVLKSIKELENVLVKPEPSVAISSLSTESVTLTLRFWISNGQFATTTEVMYALHTLLPAAELTVKEAAGDV